MRVNDILFSCYNNIALSLLFEGAYEDALINAQKGFELDPEDEIIYTKLALAYLFNNQYQECEEILKTHRLKTLYNILFQEYILNKLNEFESQNITHPDFEKVRELLNSENTKNND